MNSGYGLPICDECGMEINCDEANDGSKYGRGTLCNECLAELEWEEHDEMAMGNEDWEDEEFKDET